MFAHDVRKPFSMIEGLSIITPELNEELIEEFKEEIQESIFRVNKMISNHNPYRLESQ